MIRRAFLLVAVWGFLGIASGMPGGWFVEAGETAAIELKPGPHLFVDDYLVAKSQNVIRKVVKPKRHLNEPIVTGQVEYQNWQPFLTVLHDPDAPASGRFRMWYNVDVVDDPRDGQWFGKTGYLESSDGVHWPGPYQRLNSLTEDGRVRFGASVVDDGPRHRVPRERYKMLYFDVGDKVGPRVAFSPDGLEWSVHGGNPILPKTPSDDIWTAGYDPIRQRYFLIGKHYGTHSWTNAEGEKLNVPIRRYFTSFSQDFKTWSDPKGFVFSPDEKDTGVIQWYGTSNFVVRGDLILTCLRVLRDDLSPAGVPQAAIDANVTGSGGVGSSSLGKTAGSGMGNTVLAWTRDGVTWQRDRHSDNFFEPDPQVGSWDHAMAWIGSMVPVRDEVFLYYAGYRWGHKYQHSVDRQFGLVKMKRDRYVARETGDEGGTVSTPLVKLDAAAMSLNVAAEQGSVRVQITTPDDKPIPGFRFEDCTPITTDSLDAPVKWKGDLQTLRGQPVKLEFSLKNAQLFAFELAAPR